MSRIIGADPFAIEPIQTFLREMDRRPHCQRVQRDAEPDDPLFRAHLRALYG